MTGYRLDGSLLEACSCEVLCPCWIGEEPSDEQFDAIHDAFAGKLGGPLADLAGLFGEVVAVERAPISHETREGKGTLRIGAIVFAWIVAIAAEASGVAHNVHHDVLLEDGPPFGVALVAFLLAWQLMIAAMMLPSSLPLVRLFAVASRGQPRPAAAMAGFLAGYALVWSGFGALALAFDLGVHRGVDSIAWLKANDWLIGGSVLAVAGAFQFTKLKDACLKSCR